MLRFTPFPTCLNLHPGTDGLTDTPGFYDIKNVQCCLPGYKPFGALRDNHRLGRCVITIVSNKSMASNMSSEFKQK